MVYDTPRRNHAIRQKEDPDPVPPLTVLLDYLVLVRYPILIPPIECGRIVHPKYINVLYLETSGLQLCNDPAQGARSVSAGEDILVHEKAPNEILVLPRRANACDLENENTIVVQEVVNLTEERAITADTDMLKWLSAIRFQWRKEVPITSAISSDTILV